MNNQMHNHWLVRHTAFWLATCFGVGLFPVAPGTVCSAVTAIIFFLLPPLSWLAWALFFIVTLIIGVWSASEVEAFEKKKDPGHVVIDELLGQAMVLCIVPKTLLAYVIAFGLFRVFDICKVWPACAIERRVPGGWGIMLDDIVAGLWAMIICAMVFYQN